MTNHLAKVNCAIASHQQLLEYHELKDKYTIDLFSKFANGRTFLTKEEFFQIGHWKSPRRAKHIISGNPGKTVEIITEYALAERDECVKMRLPSSLDGVGIPTASAVLAVLSPERYGVIDVRAWARLSYFGIIEEGNQSKNIFNYEDLDFFLRTITNISHIVRKSPRQIEYWSYKFDKEIMKKQGRR